MRTRNYDDWTIDRWRLDPPLRGLSMEVDDAADQNPPLWKDVTVASVIALALWGMAAFAVG